MIKNLFLIKIFYILGHAKEQQKITFEGPLSFTGVGPRDVLESLVSKID